MAIGDLPGVVCGGGVFNVALIQQLPQARSTAVLGVDPMQVEALRTCLAGQQLCREPTIPPLTGAVGPRVLGARVSRLIGDSSTRALAGATPSVVPFSQPLARADRFRPSVNGDADLSALSPAAPSSRLVSTFGRAIARRQAKPRRQGAGCGDVNDLDVALQPNPVEECSRWRGLTA